MLHPVPGDVAGTIDLTTWSDSSSGLLLALAEAAAGATSGLMLQRATGRPLPPAPPGEVVRVVAPVTTVDGDDPCVIVRCPTEPGTTVTRAATALGTGRATPYRTIAQYGLTLPG